MTVWQTMIDILTLSTLRRELQEAQDREARAHRETDALIEQGKTQFGLVERANAVDAEIRDLGKDGADD